MNKKTLSKKEKIHRASFHYDWKNGTRGWQYDEDAPKDKKWQKDRLELFQENGNGWWWYQGAPAPTE